MHVAEQDAVPLVLLIGQVSRQERGRGVFQEMDYAQFFGGMAKGVYEEHDPNKYAETMARAFRLAASGVPGPVVVVLPEDVLGGQNELRGAGALPDCAAPSHGGRCHGDSGSSSMRRSAPWR